MNENNWLKRNGYFRIGAGLAIVLAFTLLFQAFGSVIMSIYDEIAGTGLKETPALVVIVATGFGEIVVMLLGSMLLVRILRQDPIRTFRLQGFYETPALAYVLALPLIFSAQLAGSMLAVLWDSLLKQIPQLYTQLSHVERLSQSFIKGAFGPGKSIAEAVTLFVVIAIVPALSEEIVCRGFLQTNIELSGKNRSRPYVSLIWTSLAFAAIHFEPIEFPGLLVLGLVLGWMSYRTGNLLVGSVGHVANNGVIVLVLLLVHPGSEGIHSVALSDTETSIPQALLTLGLVLPVLAICMVAFYRITEPLTARNAPIGLFTSGAEDPDESLNSSLNQNIE